MLLTAPALLNAQVDAYVGFFGSTSGTSSFANPDLLSIGTSQGLWQVYDASHISGPSPTYLSNLNGSSSPQGGNYWVGQMQGPGGGASNFPALLSLGIDASALLGANGSSLSLQHGESYVVHLWMNPLEFVTDDGTGPNAYSTGALPFTVNGMGILDSNTLSILSSDAGYSRNIAFGTWTDLAIDFTYDSAWGSDFRISLGSTSLGYGGNMVIDQQVISGTEAPGVNRVQSVAIDFMPVPEPSSAILLLGVLVRWSFRRQRK